MCQEHDFPYNFIRVHLTSELKFDDDMFVTLIDYALLIKPCVVLFDRCDWWFRPDNYALRGEKFVLAHAGYPHLVEENVFFIFSCDIPLPIMHGGFREFISYHNFVESHLDQDDCERCFHHFFTEWIMNLCQQAPIMDQQRDEYSQWLIKCCKQLAGKYSHFWTPGMIKTFCERVMQVARRRAVNQAGTAVVVVEIELAFPRKSDRHYYARTNCLEDILISKNAYKFQQKILALLHIDEVRSERYFHIEKKNK